MTLSIKYYVMFNIAWFFLQLFCSSLPQLTFSTLKSIFSKHLLNLEQVQVAAGPTISSNKYHLLLSYVFV